MTSHAVNRKEKLLQRETAIPRKSKVKPQQRRTNVGKISRALGFPRSSVSENKN